MSARTDARSSGICPVPTATDRRRGKPGHNGAQVRFRFHAQVAASSVDTGQARARLNSGGSGPGPMAESATATIAVARGVVRSAGPFVRAAEVVAPRVSTADRQGRVSSVGEQSARCGGEPADRGRADGSVVGPEPAALGVTV